MQLERVPIRDFDPIDLRAKLKKAVSALDALVRRNHRVYVHCTAGVGRAPAVAIAWLAWCQGWEMDEAVRHVRQRRACSPFVEAIYLAARDRLD
jgi:protein-tyrosine phosphatase